MYGFRFLHASHTHCWKFDDDMSQEDKNGKMNSLFKITEHDIANRDNLKASHNWRILERKYNAII